MNKTPTERKGLYFLYTLLARVFLYGKPKRFSRTSLHPISIYYLL